MKKGKVLGIDIGGSGVKGGIVDLAKGELIGERVRVPTPKSRDPNMLIDAIAQIVDAFEWKGKIGCGFPGVVRSQVIETAANLTGKKIIGTNLAEEIGRRTNCDAWIINDADAVAQTDYSVLFGENSREIFALFLKAILYLHFIIFFRQKQYLFYFFQKNKAED